MSFRQVSVRFSKRIGLCIISHLVLLWIFPTAAASVGTRTVAQEDGVASDTFSVLFKPKEAGEKILSASFGARDESVITDVKISDYAAGAGVQNITMHLEMNGDVGKSSLVLEILTDGESPRYQMKYLVEVLGMSFTINSKGVEMGEHSSGIKFVGLKDSHRKRIKMNGKAYAGAGKFIGFSNAKILIIDEKKTGLLSPDDVEISKDGIYISPEPFKTGRVLLEIEHPDIELDGETVMTVIPIEVVGKAFPNPLILSEILTIDEESVDHESKSRPIPDTRVIDSTLQEGNVILQMRNLIDRPDSKDLVDVRGIVRNETLFVWDRNASNLNGTTQSIALVRANESVKMGEYLVDVEAEYGGGKVLPAVLDANADLIFSVLANEVKTNLQNFSGVDLRSWPFATGILAALLFVIGLGALAFWRMSISADKRLSAAYAETGTSGDIDSGTLSGGYRSGAGSQAFGVPLPIADNQDGILRDSYARNESSVTMPIYNDRNGLIADDVACDAPNPVPNDVANDARLSRLFEGKLRQPEAGGDEGPLDEETVSWFHRAQRSGALSDYPSSDFSI